MELIYLCRMVRGIWAYNCIRTAIRNVDIVEILFGPGSGGNPHSNQHGYGAVARKKSLDANDVSIGVVFIRRHTVRRNRSRVRLNNNKVV